ncbi:MAG: serine/threonine-protein kinase [Pirellulaceae bacterium]
MSAISVPFVEQITLSVATTPPRPGKRPRAATSREASIGTWRTGRRIGMGSYCDIWLAQPQPAAGQFFDYVAKVAKPQYQGWGSLAQLMRQEVQVTQSIRSPHVLPIIDAGDDADGHFLILPRVEGLSLAQRLREAGPLDCLDAIWIMRQVAQALVAVHQTGWLHADVKPANILVSSTGHVTLIDFGFARPIQSQIRRDPPSLPRHGTLCYMAPECQVQGYPISAEADLYSLGVTLFELLTGHPLPNPHANWNSWGDALPLESASQIDSLLRKLLSNDPLRRPQSAGEVASRLASIETQLLCIASA